MRNTRTPPCAFVICAARRSPMICSLLSFFSMFWTISSGIPGPLSLILQKIFPDDTASTASTVHPCGLCLRLFPIRLRSARPVSYTHLPSFRFAITHAPLGLGCIIPTISDVRRKAHLKKDIIFRLCLFLSQVYLLFLYFSQLFLFIHPVADPY